LNKTFSNAIFFGDNGFELSESTPMNKILIKTITKGIEAYCEEVIVYNMRKERFVKTMFKGRKPLSNYE